ncbi:MAG: hypothetical protein JNK05_37060 [Myxococcales bacterium]|nr:hypothetical protein [Myxococcales bacterium]
MNAAARIREIREAIGRRRETDASPLAAIEVVSLDPAQRKADRDLLRESLSAGASAEDLGALLVCVIADLAFEVDWRDQFSFWPLLHERLRSDAMDLREHDARRLVAREFERFSAAHGGLTPVGELAAQFSLMSWPLVHALMPRPALRHVAAAIAKAAKLGLTPASISEPWRADFAQRLAAVSGFPLFVLGIIENSDALEKVGRAVLFRSASSSGAEWAQRAWDALQQDEVARELVDDARGEVKRAPRAPQLSVPIELALTCARDAPAQVNVRLGPIDTTNERVLAFARTAAELRVQAGGKRAGAARLSDAMQGTAVVQIDSPTLPLKIAVKVVPEESDDEVPQALKGPFERTFNAPVVFVQSGDDAYESAEELRSGEDAAILLASDAATPTRMTRRKVRGSGAMIALFGRLDDGTLATLSARRAAGRARLSPRITPPLRQSNGHLTYEEGRRAWLELEDADRQPDIVAAMKTGVAEVAAEVGEDAAGRILVRTPPLVAGEHELVVRSGPSARALASIKITATRRPGAPAARWRAALRPDDATINHLVSAQCSLDIDAMAGITLELALRLDDREPKALVLDRDEQRSLPRLAQRIAKLYAEQSAELAAPSRVDILAREADDDAWTTVAALTATPPGLRFDASSDPISVLSPDDEAKVYRVELGGDAGARLVPAGSTREAGVYIAAAGSSRAAVVIADRARSVPRLAASRARTRGAERCAELLAVLRALDVAALAPRGAEGAALLARNAAARSVERELVLELCGSAWANMEDTADDGDDEHLPRAMARLLWLPEDELVKLAESAVDPVEAIQRIGELRESAPVERELHLTLALSCRGLSAPSRDADALLWAVMDVQRGRAARAAALLFLRRGGR